MRKYTDYWTAPAPQPRSISVLESIAKKFRIRWRPTDASAYFIAHQAANDESRWYENQLAEYIPDVINKGIDEKALDAAHQNEIRHRIFKSIYWGNLYDDLMPIEARSFTTTGQRKAKLALMIITACALYSIIYLVPSIAYSVASKEDAIFQTSTQKLRQFSTPELGQTYYNALLGEGANFPEVEFDTSIAALDDAVILREKISSIVRSSTLNSKYLLESPIWKSANSADRELLLSDVLFFHILVSNEDDFSALNHQARLVTAPYSNLNELFSQLVLLASTMILISWFLSKKNHFFSVIIELNRNWWTAAILSLEETILGNFYFRKKFHYAVAMGLASIAILLHYYTIDAKFSSISAPSASVLDLKAFDYRIAATTVPVAIVNWALQIVLGYTLALVCWELKLLNECMKIWQVKIREIGMFPNDAYDKFFQRMNENQFAHRMSLMTLTVVPLAVFSFFKFWYHYPSIDWASTGLDQIGLSNLTDASEHVNLWALWALGYIWSPPILLIVLILMTGGACLPTIESTAKFKSRRPMDLDASIEYVLKRGEKILALRRMWKKLQDELGLQDPAVAETGSRAEPAKNAAEKDA